MRPRRPDPHGLLEVDNSDRRGSILTVGRGPTPPLFLCKCSLCKSCTRGLRELATDDRARFRGGKCLTQSAQRHGEHGEKGGGLKVWCSADDLFELEDFDWPGAFGVLFFWTKHTQREIPRSGSSLGTMILIGSSSFWRGHTAQQKPLAYAFRSGRRSRSDPRFSKETMTRNY